MKRQFLVGTRAALQWLTGLCLAVGLSGCGNDAAPVDGSASGVTQSRVATDEIAESRIRFVERTADSGLNFSVSTGADAGHLTILETLGAGAGAADFDADGWPDVFVAGGGSLDAEVHPGGKPAGLFRQIEPWRFAEITGSAVVDQAPFYSHGVAVADWNNDGFCDVLLTGYHGLLLYENRGDGTFADATRAAGLQSNAWSTSAAWADFNGDSVLDLYVVNYLDWSPEVHSECFVLGGRDVCPPSLYAPQQDYLFLADGAGQFEEVAGTRGIQPDGKGLAVLAADIDLDGDVDLYVANDTTPNQLYWNDGDAHFDEAGLTSGTGLGENASADGSMGVDLGDFNGDGLPDLWVSNYENQSFALYRNEGHRVFEHVSATAGITSVGQMFVGFGTAFSDLDLDGDLDLVAVNGHVMTREVNSPFLQRPLVFENLNHRRFRETAETVGPWFHESHLARGLVVADIDRDQLGDLIVTQSNRPVALLQNRSQADVRAISLRLIATSGNRDAVGTIVRQNGDQQVYLDQVKGGRSYLSAGSPAELLLTAGPSAVVELSIAWGGGRYQTATLNGSTHSEWVLVEGESPKVR